MTKRILIVDDDPDIRDITQLALQKFANWEVWAVASGLEALERAGNLALDAILLDVAMPDMDGFSVFEQLQSNPVTQKIPVILLTAKALMRDQQQFSSMGVAGVITKPFNPVTIWTQISKILGWIV